MITSLSVFHAQTQAIPTGLSAPPPPPAFDPESGLLLSREFSPGEIIANHTLMRSAPAVFAASFTGLDGSSGGLISEFGASAVGAYFGFRANGDFIARCGSGSETGPPFASGKTGYVLNSEGIVHGDGTLVIEFVPGVPVSVRAWWNGQPISENEAGSAGAPDWCGSDPGKYLGTFESKVVVGEVASAAVTYSTASALRYYANQTVPA